MAAWVVPSRSTSGRSPMPSPPEALLELLPLYAMGVLDATEGVTDEQFVRNVVDVLYVNR